MHFQDAAFPLEWFKAKLVDLLPALGVKFGFPYVLLVYL